MNPGESPEVTRFTTAPLTLAQSFRSDKTMHSQPLSVRIALAATFLAGCVAITAHAADTISFKAGSPWAQSVGKVSKNDNFHEYLVNAAPGKTLQINLISRNPNLHFRVLPPDSRTPLVDTQKTGATTWSDKMTTATVYTVRVYEDPDTVASDDVTKYALQVGIF